MVKTQNLIRLKWWHNLWFVILVFFVQIIQVITDTGGSGGITIDFIVEYISRKIWSEQMYYHWVFLRLIRLNHVMCIFVGINNY